MADGRSFAELLRETRLRHGLTQEELAERAQLSARAISDLERGLKRAPRPSTVRMVVTAMGLTEAEGAQLLAAARPVGVQDERRAPAHNLPRELSSFVGRDQELSQLNGLVQSTALLTLTGTGGVGKTRLALKLAEQTLSDHPDGVWFVDLAPLTDPSLVPQATAAAVGIRERPGQPVLDALATGLCNKHLLLVLDNCEHLISASANLADTLLRACPHVRILATSREPLAIDGEVLWRVPSLSLPGGTDNEPEQLLGSEAIRLFVERAIAHLPAFCLDSRTAGGVDRICRELEGIPLALELAAARVRVLSVDQIAARLHDRIDILSTADRTTPRRHQTLRATIDWSYALLTAMEQRVFRGMTVFVGGCSPEAAESVCATDGVESAEVLDILWRLVDKSLVVAEAGPDGLVRYRLLEPLRQFGQPLSPRAELEAVRRQHAEYFLALSQRADPELFGSPNQISWLDRLEVEHDNLRAALSFLSQSGDVLGGLELAGALRRFWVMRNYFNEGRGWVAHFISMPGGDAPTPARARALNAAGLLATGQGDFVAARSLHEEACRLFRAHGDRTEEAWSLWRLGDVLTWLGEHEAARSRLEDAIAMARSVGEQTTVGASLKWLADLEMFEGDARAARMHAAEALGIFTTLRWPRGIEWSLRTLGGVSLYEGDYSEARTRYEQCVLLGREQSDRQITASALTELGLVLAVQGEAARAREHLAQALGMAKQLGLKKFLAEILEAFAWLAASHGLAPRAVRLASAAEGLREAIGASGSWRSSAIVMPAIAASRSRLGHECAVAAWTKGRAMTLEDAMAYALEDELATDAATPTGRRPLTPREIGVLQLLSGGSTNAEIADQLVLSLRTVERHIANIYVKIGARGRVDATAYALRYRIARSDHASR